MGRQPTVTPVRLQEIGSEPNAGGSEVSSLVEEVDKQQGTEGKDQQQVTDVEGQQPAEGKNEQQQAEESHQQLALGEEQHQPGERSPT